MGIRAALPVIAVTGMAFEARIVCSAGVDTVYAARADWLKCALAEAATRGCAGVISFGTAGGLAPGLTPGALIVADAIVDADRRVLTDLDWSARLVAALDDTPITARRGALAAVAAPVVSAPGKAALYHACGALAVDMESSIACAFASSLGVPFVACRVIVDSAEQTLPSAAMAGLRDDGSTAVLPVLRELVKQPAQLGPLMRIAAAARVARATLTQACAAFERTGALRII